VERRELRVRRGKGAKDRVTVIPEAALGMLHRHMESARAQHTRDLALGGGWVSLPYALGRKYRNAGRSWAGSGCFRRGAGIVTVKPAKYAGITSILRRCSGRWRKLYGPAGSRSERAATRCGIHLRPISWNQGRTFAQCRSCSVTGTYRRRCSTHTC
jgi:hypothetical protein